MGNLHGSAAARWTRRLIQAALPAALLALLLSGCAPSGGPSGQGLAAAAAEVDDSVAVVQHAVDKYRAQTHVLPIKNSTDTTPLYERNVVDFNRLRVQRDIGEIPKGAFENGGDVLFVIVHAETDPKVKALDLSIVQHTGDVQQAVNRYIVAHKGALPVKEQLAPHFYYLDYAKLKMDPVQIRSPFTGNYLPLVIHEGGDVVVDYGADIMNLLKSGQVKPPDPSADLRELLVAHSDYVPVKSYPYRLVNGEPQIEVQ